MKIYVLKEGDWERANDTGCVADPMELGIVKSIHFTLVGAKKAERELLAKIDHKWVTVTEYRFEILSGRILSAWSK